MNEPETNAIPASLPAPEWAMDASAMADDLAALGKRARPVLRTALREESSPIAVAAKALIHSRTGLLASGVRARSGSGDRPDRVSALVQSVSTRAKFANYRGRRVRKVAAGAGSDRYNVYYGMALETGHELVSHGVVRGTVKAFPWMGPAFDQRASAIPDRVMDRVAAAVGAD